jgi:hypothetical protein
MKQHDNSSPSKANSTTKDLNNSEEKEIIKYWILKNNRMTNELKEETQKLVSDLKEDMNKQLNEFK